MIILNICLPKSQSIWTMLTTVFWTTCSLGHQTSQQTAGNPVKMKWNKAGANLSLSYRFAPVLYRYGLSTVYQMFVDSIWNTINKIQNSKQNIVELCRLWYYFYMALKWWVQVIQSFKWLKDYFACFYFAKISGKHYVVKKMSFYEGAKRDMRKL